MPRRRRREQTLERVLGTPALLATAYGNVGSSIYYALGLVAGIALGLTPLVFVISGLIFAATAATYAEGTVRYPEAGGSSSFARHAFNELVSFGAAWAQMLNYIITIAISAFFVPHYLSIFWGPLRENPWDIVGGATVVAVLVGLNIVGIKEAARLNILLAVADFATQLLLVLIGFALVFNPHVVFSANLHWGVAPTWSAFLLAIPIAMIAYTGIETVSNLAEEARDPPRDIPRSISWVAGAVFAIYFTLPLIALSALPVHRVDGGYATLLGEQPKSGGGGGFPADPGDLPAVASEVQDAVAVTARFRRDHLDRRSPARQDDLPRQHVRVRGDALVLDRPCLDHRTAGEAPRPRDALSRPPEPARRRCRLAPVRDLRRARDGGRLARGRRPKGGRPLGRFGMADPGADPVRELPALRRARGAARNGAGAHLDRPGNRAGVPQHPGPGEARTRVGGSDRLRLPARGRAPFFDRGGQRRRGAARAASRRRPA